MSVLPKTFQHLTAVVAIACPLVTGGAYLLTSWGGMDRRLTTVETTTEELRRAQIDNEARNVAALGDLRKSLEEIDRRAHETSDDLRLGVRRIDDKLTALFIQGYQPQARSGPASPTR